MSEAIKNIEIIERYFEGRMDSIEKIDFENRLLNEPELNEEFQLYKLIVEGIKEKGTEDLKARLKIADLELDANTNKEIRLQPKKSSLPYWSIAAALILIFGIGFIWKISSNQNLSDIANTYYEKDKGLPNEMSLGANRFDKVMQAYKANDFKQASSYIDELLIENLNNDTLLFYNAVVKFELEDYKKAKEYLSQVNINSAYFQKAQYRAVLVELKLNNKQEALKIINECLADKNHLYFDKLSKLKKELSE